MPNRVNLDDALRLIDGVQNSVRPTARRVITVKRIAQWLSDPLGIHRDRSPDGFQRRGRDIDRKILVQIAMGRPCQSYGVRFSVLGSRRPSGDVVRGWLVDARQIGMVSMEAIMPTGQHYGL
jgi:hypothetical protein